MPKPAEPEPELGPVELATLRTEVRAARDVLASSLERLDQARASVREAVARRLDAVTLARLDTIPVARLRDLLQGSVRIGALESAGIGTVASVVSSSPALLHRIPGVGPSTAIQVCQAAAQLAQRMRGDVRQLPDPDDPTPEDIPLLRALDTLDRHPATRPGVEGSARRLLGELDSIIRSLDRVPGRFRWRFTSARKKESYRRSGRSARSVVGDAATAELIDALRMSSSKAATLRPSPELLWERYQQRASDYAALLETVGADGVVGTAPSLRGGVAADIAARVERIQLQLVGMKATLRGYQHFGVQYLIGQQRSILGDEMGLGKTIQALAAMCHLRSSERHEHFLVVAPASILTNWTREVSERTDMEAHLLHGPQRDSACWRWANEGGVGVTSYSTLPALPLDELGAARRPGLVVIDEAHYVKNPRAKRSAAVRELLSRSGAAVLMSGTPMENRVEEFRSLVSVLQPPHEVVLDPGALLLAEGDADAFRQQLSPIYLRRNQEDVLTELPERLELEEWVVPRSADLAAYRDAVAAGEIMAMRQAATLGAGFRSDLDAVHSSAKFARLAELLEEYEIEQRKVVVFSYFRRVLDAVSELAGGCSQITGSVAPRDRLAVIDDFTKRQGHAVMASQIDAGGVGINLQAASVVILVEPQWKPSTEDQAIARAHRMGQTRKVVVHRLLARGTLDEWLMSLKEGKQDLFDRYARPSAVKEATGAATNTTVLETTPESELAQRAVSLERERLGLAG